MALALFAAHLRTVSRSTSSAFAWMLWSSVRYRSRPGTSAPLALYVDDPAARILDDRLLAGAARERLFELQLEARQPVAVRPDEPEHLRRHRSLGIGAALLGIEAEPRELQPLQRGGLCGVRLAGDVDEAVRTVGERSGGSGRRSARACVPRPPRRGADSRSASGWRRRSSRARPARARGRCGRRSSRGRRECVTDSRCCVRPRLDSDSARTVCSHVARTSKPGERESDRREKEPDPPVD